MAASTSLRAMKRQRLEAADETVAQPQAAAEGAPPDQSGSLNGSERSESTVRSGKAFVSREGAPVIDGGFATSEEETLHASPRVCGHEEVVEEKEEEVVVEEVEVEEARLARWGGSRRRRARRRTARGPPG